MTVLTNAKTSDGGVPPSARSARWAAALAAVLGLLASSPAAAQDGSASTPDDETASGEVSDGPLSEELERYWSTERDLSVLKDRKYRRKGKFGAGLMVGLMSSEAFYWYIPVGLRAGYHFTDHWSVEVEGMFMGGALRQDTDLTDFLESDREDFRKDKDGLDQFKWRAHALAVWHPMYGKLAALQRKLAHFDFNLAAGLGVVGLDRPGKLRNDMESTVEPEFVFGGGFQFFVTENITLRLAGRGYVYPGPMNFRDKKTGDRTVTEPDSESRVEKVNFFQRLTFATEFLLGATYMF